MADHQTGAYSVIREADEREHARLRNVAEDSTDSLRPTLIATSAVIDGDPRDVILTAAEAFQADAIFVGARGSRPDGTSSTWQRV